jgi:4-hydroxy-tetrahydrodipicolinate synthase
VKALKSQEIYGNWAIPLLPIEEDESINFEKLSEEIDVLIAAGVNGIYCNGTAGEFYNQTEEEFDKISSLLAEKCSAAQMPFQIGCSHMSPKISLERLKRILPLKPGAIQVILPDWYPPSMDEIISYLQKMSDAASNIGLVLYNPGHAKRKLSPEDFCEIQKHNINLVGCKVGGGDEAWYTKMKMLNPELSLFVPGHRLATGIGLGAHGSYSNVACLNPKVAQAWYESMLLDMKSALELEGRIQLFINTYVIPYITDKKYSDQAVDKLLAAIGGWANVGTRLRWPYQWIEEKEVKKMRTICKDILPEFF